jgi:cation:H+ antiporter
VLADLALVAAGIVLLYYGGEHLVSGATQLARALGLSALVIGLTVVAFGTSAPELAASVMAAVFRDAPEIAMANVVGSNIANIGLILGVAAIIAPLEATAPFLRREVPLMILVSALLIPLVAEGLLVRWVGALLVALLAAYLWLLFRIGAEVPLERNEADGPRPAPLSGSLRALLGIALLALGARILVDGAISAATDFGVSQRIIGLTLVAIGTSLPELATVIVAAMKREGDLVLGNLVGSNIFNILGILGITLLIRPFDIVFAEVWVDLVVMTAFAVAIWPLLLFRMRIGTKRGVTLLLAYLAYLLWLFV